MDLTVPRDQILPQISPIPLAPSKFPSGRQRFTPSGTSPCKQKNVLSSKTISSSQNSSKYVRTPTKNWSPTFVNGSSNVTKRKFFNSPKKSKSIGADDDRIKSISPSPRRPISPKIFVSPPTPETLKKHPSRSVSPDGPKSQQMQKTWQSIEYLADRKSDVVPLNARKRSSSIHNAIVKKEFSNYSVQIGVRIRPFVENQSSMHRVSREFVEASQEVVKANAPGSIKVKNDDQEFKFNFEHIFSIGDVSRSSHWSINDQERVYNEMGRPLVQAVVDGFNCCFLAYGQTGSGKTFSTMGPNDCPGVIPRFCRDLFQRLDENSELDWILEVGYYEIYNEKIRDLLITDVEHHSQLKIREHPETGPYIDGLGCFPVRTFEQIKSWMDFGNRQRATAATMKNDQSSRSHAIFMLKLSQKKLEYIEGSPKEYTRSSCAYLVDLAGSERACTSNDLKETSSINKSLSCLGKVILQLAEKKQQYINYRDSILTWLLKEYLGGNSKTAMLITVSPCQNDVEESLSSLRYASQAKAIVNRICVNEDPAIIIIKKLKTEMELLKKQQLKPSDGPVVTSKSDASIAFHANLLQQEIDTLNRQLAEVEAKRREDNEMFQRRLEEERINLLSRSQLKVRLSSSYQPDVIPGRPYLALLSGDALVSSPFLFDFGSGEEIPIGSSENSLIRLENAAVPSQVCCVSITGQYLMVVRRNDDPDVKLRVNGVDVDTVKILNDGDYLNVCNDYFLRVWYPRTSSERLNCAAEYEKAKVQLLSILNAKLHEELDRRVKELNTAHEAQLKKYLQEKDSEIENSKKSYQIKINELERLLEEEKSFANNNKSSAISTEYLVTRRSELLIEVNEAKLEYDDSVSFRSELLVEIEKLSKKVLSPQPFVYNYTKRRRSSLASADQLVIEANMFLKDWRKQFEFTYEESYDDEGNPNEVMIRLTNTKLGLFALLTVVTFKKRLEKLRALYESGSITGANLENVLMNPDDNWKCMAGGHDDNLLNTAVANSLKKVRRRSSFNGNLRRNSSISPGSFRRNSFLLNTTLGQNSFLSQIAERPQMENYKMLSTLLQNDITVKKCHNIESIFDKALDACNEAAQSVKALSEDENIDSAIDFGSKLLRCYWSFTLYDQVFMNFDHLGTVKVDFVDKLDVTTSTIQLIFKTIEFDIVHVRRQLSLRFKENLNDVCNLLGTIAALWSSKLVVHFLSSCKSCTVDRDILTNFINGFCDGYDLKRKSLLKIETLFVNEPLISENLKIYRAVGECFESLDGLVSSMKNRQNFDVSDEFGFICCRVLHTFSHRIAKLSTKTCFDSTFIGNLSMDVNTLLTLNKTSVFAKDLSTLVKRLDSLEKMFF